MDVANAIYGLVMGAMVGVLIHPAAVVPCMILGSIVMSGLGEPLLEGILSVIEGLIE